MSDKLRAAALAALYEFRNAEWDGWNPIIKKLEAAIAEPEPEPEPVAWLVTYRGLTHVEYTQPNMVVDTHYQSLCAAPPRREWVGLTHEERYLDDGRTDEEIEYAKAIEAKLKEKNT